MKKYKGSRKLRKLKLLELNQLSFDLFLYKLNNDYDSINKKVIQSSFDVSKWANKYDFVFNEEKRKFEKV